MIYPMIHVHKNLSKIAILPKKVILTLWLLTHKMDIFNNDFGQAYYFVEWQGSTNSKQDGHSFIWTIELDETKWAISWYGQKGCCCWYWGVGWVVGGRVTAYSTVFHYTDDRREWKECVIRFVLYVSISLWEISHRNVPWHLWPVRTDQFGQPCSLIRAFKSHTMTHWIFSHQ